MSFKTLLFSVLLLTSLSNAYADEISVKKAKRLLSNQELELEDAIKLPQEVFTDEMAEELGMSPFVETGMGLNGYIFTQSKAEMAELFEKAQVVIHVNKGIRSNQNPNGQTAIVYRDGVMISSHDVSTGTEQIKTTTSGRKYRAVTPTGVFRPTKAYTKYDSRAFLGANMDYAIFFRGGIALHSTGTGNYKKLGKRASGGCVRFRRDEIQDINELVVSLGEDNMRTVNQSFTVNGTKLNRIMYINRDKFKTVDRYTGKLNSDKMWTYDSLIVVTDK